MTSTESVLEIKNLTKAFGSRNVVSDISFEVQRGEIFGFLGPNGSGKTTTIRMALGIIRPDSGSVSILGHDPDRQVLKRVGYLPEDRGLLRKVCVMDIVLYLGRLKGLTKSEATERGTELLHRVGLYPHRHKKVESLSRGMT
jgi:ABC-2 type transport system ATP-binding protein